MSEPVVGGGRPAANDSSWGRLAGALVSPVKTFRAIAARPTWGVAFAVLVVIGAVATFAIFQKIDFAEAVREQLARQGREVPPGAESGSGFFKGCFIAAGLFLPALFYLVAAAVFLLFNLVGGQLKYRASLAVVVHATLPRALAALLAIPVVLSRGSIALEEVQNGGLLRSNLAFLAPEGAAAPLLVLLANLDLFTFWTLALLILGYHFAARVSKATAATTVLLLWVAGIALQMGLAALRGAGG